MVASIQVITGSVGSAGAYFLGGGGAAVVEYYGAEDGRQYSRWMGTGAQQLGLCGAVKREAFELLLSGRHPGSGKSLLSRTSQRGAKTKEPTKKRLSGVDLTFSVPKEVSAVWAVAPAKVKRSIEKCVWRSVESTLNWLEANVTLARGGKAGIDKKFAKLMAAAFLHTTSRAGEPQLHVHSVIANVVGLAGGYRCLDTRNVFRWTRTLGPVFRTSLAEGLWRLGFSITRPQEADGRPSAAFQIEGVPKSLVQAWSTRKDEIAKSLKGMKSVEAQAQARSAAAVATRKSKQKMSLEKLVQGWKETARQHGFGPQKVLKLMRSEEHTRTPDKRLDLERSFQNIWNLVKQRVVQEEAHFPAREAVQWVAQSCEHLGVNGAQLASRALKELQRCPEIIRLGTLAGEVRYTTKAMHEMEKEMLGFVEHLRKESGAQVHPEVIEVLTKAEPKRALALGKRGLNEEQAKAVRAILEDSSAIRVLTGAAGSGKSSTLSAVRRGLKVSGYQVIGATLSGAAKEELMRSSNIPSRTAAYYMYHWDKQGAVHNGMPHTKARAPGLARSVDDVKKDLTKKTVLVIDEAAMLDTKSLSILLKHVKEAKATVVLCGDTKQLQAIGPGGGFAYIAAELGGATLATNLRQQNVEDKRAVAELRRGNVTEALASYAKRGRLTVAESRIAAQKALVESWKMQGGLLDPRSHVIFTQTRAERDTINKACQSARKKAGLVTGNGLKVENHDGEIQKLHAGDRIIFHRAVGYGIVNGSTGSVVAVDTRKREIQILLDVPSPEMAKRGATNQLIKISSKPLKPGDLTLSYANTAHKLQGATCAHAYVLTGGTMTHRELGYVQATRARMSTRIFVDQLHAGENRKELERAMGKSREKRMAHQVQEQGRQGPSH